MKTIFKEMKLSALAAFIAAALSVLMLTGCGKAAESPAPPETANEPVSEISAAVEALAEDTATDYSTGAPWLYSCIKGVIDENTETNAFYMPNNNSILYHAWFPRR